MRCPQSDDRTGSWDGAASPPPSLKDHPWDPTKVISWASQERRHTWTLVGVLPVRSRVWRAGSGRLRGRRRFDPPPECPFFDLSPRLDTIRLSTD